MPLTFFSEGRRKANSHGFVGSAPPACWNSPPIPTGLTAEARDGRTIIRPAHHVYDLRRPTARNMRRAGVHETITAITGHRTRSMFDRYNIVSEQDLRDAVVKTTAYVSTLPAAPTVIPLHPVEAVRP